MGRGGGAKKKNLYNDKFGTFDYLFSQNIFPVLVTF